MSFEHFKNAIKDLNLDGLNRELQERKKTLFKWNYPHERMVEFRDNSNKTYSKHAYKKIRKEIAILNQFIQHSINHRDEKAKEVMLIS